MNKSLSIANRPSDINSVLLQDKKTVSTETLMNLLDCGRSTATYIGKSANARVQVGKRILWNTKLIQQYIDNIAE